MTGISFFTALRLFFIFYASVSIVVVLCLYKLNFLSHEKNSRSRQYENIVGM